MRQFIQLAVVLFLAGTAAGCGLDVLAGAIIGSATHRDTYCQESSGAVYMRPSRSGICDTGDKEIEFEAYRLLHQANAEAQTRELIAAKEAARNAKTYCLTKLSDTPYIAASGACQPADRQISESDYKDRKANQAASLTAPPATPE